MPSRLRFYRHVPTGEVFSVEEPLDAPPSSSVDCEEIPFTVYINQLKEQTRAQNGPARHPR
jgi:hypothetical protein